MIPVELSFGSHTGKMLIKEERSLYMELVYQMSIALIMSKGKLCVWLDFMEASKRPG